MLSDTRNKADNGGRVYKVALSFYFWLRLLTAPSALDHHCHRCDFDLASGKSGTGLRTCTYEVLVRELEIAGEAKVWYRMAAAVK